MKAIIHIGLPKSGSTSIQRLLKLNQDILKNIGFHVQCDTRELLDHGLGLQNARFSLPAGSHTWIYSDERLSSRLTKPEQVERAVNAVGQHAQEMRILAYVRRQDEVFVSAYFTMLTSGETRRFSELDIQPLQRPFKQLRLWEQLLGRGRLIVKRYGDEYLPKGLLADFCKQCGMDKSTLQFPGDANVSPTTDVLELLRLINIRFAGHSDRQQIVKSLARISGKSPRLGLSRDSRERLNFMASREDTVLAERYLQQDTLFYHPFPDDFTPDVLLRPDDIVDLIRNGGMDWSLTSPPTARQGMDAVLDWVASNVRQAS